MPNFIVAKTTNSFARNASAKFAKTFFLFVNILYTILTGLLWVILEKTSDKKIEQCLSVLLVKKKKYKELKSYDFWEEYLTVFQVWGRDKELTKYLIDAAFDECYANGASS